MEFQFTSLADFMMMSGHGPYVWSCYAVTALGLLYLVVAPLRKRRRFIAQQRRQQQIQAANQTRLETARQ
ncbi:heme exporter protein CcmD [Exilibacterium tricleocarpae]|uniref:Heme exporter protein D n=1 Tax=Exilibacterium tricleocarpae TaxID=2591008 RepID=A0A545TLY2_9GAMM|nr:heme exporter protein CcmD [Exilibacterium tricleocarpae]TQV78242.1 heme exporter protein CcmD [Exilibacterium tricleocarpae]